MANRKINALVSITIVGADMFAVYDDDGTTPDQTKKITFDDLNTAIVAHSTIIEGVQDIIGTMLVDTDTINLTYDDDAPNISASVIVQMSITSDASGIKLDGDSGSPGTNAYYGTDGTGVKGFYGLPSDGSAAVQSNLDTHTSDTNNPHSVNASQVGNGTAQWNADQLQGVALTISGLATNDILIYNGSNWINAADGLTETLTFDATVPGSVTSLTVVNGRITAKTTL